MQLNDILKVKYTDEEYLIHQRELHKERCEKAVAWVKKDINNEKQMKALHDMAHYSMQNMFSLPGTMGKRIHVGTPPAWHECRTEDEEYLWSLNRTHYFSELTALYHLTGERTYAEKVMGDMINWIDTCPLRSLPDENTTPEEMQAIRKHFSGLTPWRSLEVGIRMFDSWNMAYDRLLHTDLMTVEDHTKIVRSFYEHGLVLREMSPRYWPDANHNHYLHEMLGLLEIACLFPDLKEADAWREFAIHELGRCAKAQLTDDGAQLEGSPGYHYGCLGMFFALLQLAKEFDLTLPADITDRCSKAVDYALMTSGPDGILVPFGDTACIDILNRLVCSSYKAYGELGAAAKAFAIHPTCDPDVVPEEVQAAAREFAKNAPAEDNLQRQVDQYFARTGWTRDASHFGFMCHTPVFNGHSHIDPMTFTLYLQGDPVVVDPSYYTYRECPERKLYKSPEYHSTLTFDNKHPYEYVQRWLFGPQKEGKIRSKYHFGNVYAADASHHCYDPDYHKRLCALVGDDVFFVADDVANVTGTDVRIYFHMHDPEVKVDGSVAKSDSIRVLLPADVEAEAVACERSTHTDITRPSCRVIITDRSGKSRQYLTLFTKRDDVTDPKIERTEGGIRISYKQGTEEVAFLWSFTHSLKKA